MKRIFLIVTVMACGALGGALVNGIAYAARNATGTYSLPSGNPVVTGTKITSSWANNTLTDLSTEMTDSLDRSGKGGMLAPLQGIDGTVAGPAYSWTNEAGMGFYRASSHHLSLGISGADVMEFAPGIALGPDGTSAAPGFGFMSEPGTGLYRPTTAQLGVTLNGTSAAIWKATGLAFGIANPSPTTAQTNNLTPLNIPKMWAQITTNGSGACAIAGGFNVASCSAGAASITVNLAAAASSAAVLACTVSAGGDTGSLNTVHSWTASAVTFDTYKFTTVPAITVFDPATTTGTWMIMCFGQQ